jgi:hypothetical protein
MTELTDLPKLEAIAYEPYLNELGDINPDLNVKIGIYAIFDRDRTLQYVGFSRDIASSLRLHIVRVPDLCDWVKVFIIAKPSRTFLGEVQTAWWGDRQLSPEQLEQWEQPLNCLKWLTEAENTQLEQAVNDGDRERILKDLARRIEEGILAKLAAKGIGFKVRFDPKRKNAGILDVK